jgi:imidazolonepropionase-like amidohydrolase
MDAEGNLLGDAETTYPAEIVKDVVDAAHAHSARVAVHTNTSAVGWMVRAGVDSVEHGLGLSADDLAELGRRGGAGTPTLCAVLGVGPPESRDDAAKARSRLMAELVSVAKATGVQIRAGTDVVGTIDCEIALLVEHGLTATEAMRAASVDAAGYLGAARDSGDLVTYERDPRAPRGTTNPAGAAVRGVRVR